MIFWALLFLHGAQFSGSQPNGSIGSPENITVQVLDAKTVQVFWSSFWNNVERFDVTYNPTEDKYVSVSQAAGNSQSIVLRELRPDTQYQVTITAVIGGKSYKSRRIVFRTAPDRSPKSDIYPTDALHDGKVPTTASTEYVTVDPTAKYMPLTSSTVRGVELGLVLLALVVWIVAIALFFHRWGKIRMLLPYQPDYKTQQALKVPGTGTTMGTSCAGNTGPQGPQEGPGCLQVPTSYILIHLRLSTWADLTFQTYPS
ncbi:UNVERIFIED_CONTAM: hypothetical protein PYX00_010104 [Menopon gallinae]|uniref:Fibronectin type-III domain-containing protein n=1 Tax=Menopon gallinae TaxID=328185 RepID=A0AAW2HE97_9NEOP